MPALSPSAWRSASPSVEAQSSTVWCSSMCRSPRQLSCRRSRRAGRAAPACDRRSRCRWRCGIGAVSSSSTATFDVGLAGLARHAARRRASSVRVIAGQRLIARRGVDDAQAADARSCANSQVGVAIADHGAALAVDRLLSAGTRSPARCAACGTGNLVSQCGQMNTGRTRCPARPTDAAEMLYRSKRSRG